MQRVQAGGDLHALRLVDGIPVGEVHAGFFQRRTAVGEFVLDDQVLRLFRVDKGRDKGSARRFQRGHALDAGFFQHPLDFRCWAGRNLVDHAPGEGYLGFIGKPTDKVSGHKAVHLPGMGHFHDAAL